MTFKALSDIVYLHASTRIWYFLAVSLFSDYALDGCSLYTIPSGAARTSDDNNNRPSVENKISMD